MSNSNCSIRSCFDWIISWIHFENRLDATLLILIFKKSLLNSDRNMLSLLNSYDKIRLIVRFEMNSSNDFVESQSLLSTPIGDNKGLNGSHRYCDQPINFIMISFVIIYIPVLIAWIICLCLI
jgi:hypothetical protein